MSLDLSTDLSTSGYTPACTINSTGVASLAMLFGFCFAVFKGLEHFFGPPQPFDYQKIKQSDRDDDSRTYTEIKLTTPDTPVFTQQNSSDIASFVTENVLRAEAVVEEKKEEKVQMVIEFDLSGENEIDLKGAEDYVDYINRQIG